MYLVDEILNRLFADLDAYKGPVVSYSEEDGASLEMSESAERLDCLLIPLKLVFTGFAHSHHCWISFSSSCASMTDLLSKEHRGIATPQKSRVL